MLQVEVALQEQRVLDIRGEREWIKPEEQAELLFQTETRPQSVENLRVELGAEEFYRVLLHRSGVHLGFPRVLLLEQVLVRVGEEALRLVEVLGVDQLRESQHDLLQIGQQRVDEG